MVLSASAHHKQVWRENNTYIRNDLPCRSFNSYTASLIEILTVEIIVNKIKWLILYVANQPKLRTWILQLTYKLFLAK